MMPLDEGDNPPAINNPPIETPAIEPITTPSQTPPQTDPPLRPRPFIVRALHDYEPGKPNVLSFKKGTLIRVITEFHSGWWDGRIEETNIRGWFPQTLVAKLDDPEEPESQTIVRARYHFQSHKPNCLSFERGTLIRVLTKSESGWWDGRIDGETPRRGWFPQKFVVKVDDYTAEEDHSRRVRVSLRTSRDYESDKGCYPSFKKGSLIRGAMRIRENNWVWKLKGDNRWGLFPGEMATKLDDEEQLKYMREVDQEQEGIDWLDVESQEDFAAEQPTTGVQRQNEQRVDGVAATEPMRDVDMHNQVTNEESPADSVLLDDDWDDCRVSDDEYSGAPIAIPEARLSGIGVVDSNFEVCISL